MIPGYASPGGNDDDNNGYAPTPQKRIGNYAFNPKTGDFNPVQPNLDYVKKQNIPGVTGGVNDMVRALMAGYLRKQEGGLKGYTSVAPNGILNDLKGVNNGYGQGAGEGQYGGIRDSYSALFSNPNSGQY